MKLDLVEINKLSPPGLWDVQALSAFIACLLRVMDGSIGSRLVYGRMVLRFSQELREKIRDNLNMRIKAWVLLCPKRTLWVRQIIGETAIRHWRTNRLLDYALLKYFGDWKTKFKDGFERTENKRNRYGPTAIICKIRAYKWKPFALVKIKNVYGFLYGKTAPDPEREDERAAYLKLWGVDILDTGDTPNWQQPRALRTLKPVEFTPAELVLEETEDETADVVEQGKNQTGQITFNPAEKPKLEPAKTAIKKPP